VNDTDQRTRTRGTHARFHDTGWSTVIAAGQSTSPQASAALEKLCCAYWYPLYACVRRKGRSPADAQDLVQEFFARLLEKKYLKLANPARGRFRTFLLASLQNFLTNEWRQAARAKRGGGRACLSLDADEAEGRYAREPVEEASPDKLYEKRWAATVLEQALDRLRAEFGASLREREFDELKAFIWGDRNVGSQAAMAARLSMNEGAVNVAVHRLRRRYRELLRAAIADTVSNPAEIDEELQHLKQVFSG
jgi:RNA polymerase sigma-70 factor (ECF subfamily)